MNLRSAVLADLPALNALAWEAKAHWGYSTEQLQAWADDMAVTAESLTARPVVVADNAGEPIGFAQVATDTQPWELWALWVRPAHMGKGAGKALLTWAMELAATASQAELAIDADPNAADFYLHCGARVVATVAAPIAGQPDRVRPQLRLRTGAARPAT
jgi:GNAT superfamily N-acetyltransferase